MKLNYLLLFLLVFSILSFGMVNAAKQNQEVDLRVPVRIDGGLGAADCNITVTDPNNTILVDFLEMTDQDSYQNYTLNATQTSTKGTYDYCVTCSNGELNQTECFDFFVNPSGIEPSQQRTDSITRSVYFLFGIAILMFLSFFFATQSVPVKWTVFAVGVIFLLMGINTIFISMQDEVINPVLENFFSGFLTISYYFYYFIAILLVIMWAFTFLNTWLYKKNMNDMQKFGGNY